jgi:hypothetical protein
MMNNSMFSSETNTWLSLPRAPQDTGSATQLCLSLPQYDIFTQQFAFSTCWRWACLPADFRSPQPETIKVGMRRLRL